LRIVAILVGPQAHLDRHDRSGPCAHLEADAEEEVITGVVVNLLSLLNLG